MTKPSLEDIRHLRAEVKRLKEENKHLWIVADEVAKKLAAHEKMMRLVANYGDSILDANLKIVTVQDIRFMVNRIRARLKEK